MAFNFSPKIVTSGLVLALDAGNTRSYPGSGTAWSDLTGNANNGTLTNGPTFNSANGGSIVFDGTDDFVTGNAINLNSFTSNYFVYSTDISSNLIFYPLGLQFSGSVNSGGVWFGGTYNQYANKTGLYDGSTEVTSSINVKVNTWTLVSVTRQSTTATVYINGNSVGIGTISSNPIIQYSIGKRTDDFWKYKGNIATISLYNRALSATEVLQNYNALKGRFNLT